jgi:hypothetical protein
MVHLTHSTIHWKLRCILDSSSEEDEIKSPNVQQTPTSTRDGVTSTSRDAKPAADDASTGTLTPPWLPSGTSKLGLSKVDTTHHRALQKGYAVRGAPRRRPRYSWKPRPARPSRPRHVRLPRARAVARPGGWPLLRTRAIEHQLGKCSESSPVATDPTAPPSSPTKCYARHELRPRVTCSLWRDGHTQWLTCASCTTRSPPCSPLWHTSAGARARRPAARTPAATPR